MSVARQSSSRQHPKHSLQNGNLRLLRIVDAFFAISIVITVAIGTLAGCLAFPTADRKIVLAGLGLGLLCLMRQASLDSALTQPRRVFAGLSFASAVAIMFYGLLFHLASAFGIAIGVLVFGWCVSRLTEERVEYGLLAGALVGAVFLVGGLEPSTLFDHLHTMTIHMTSLIGDLIGIANVSMDNEVMFRRFTASRFETVGVWDGVLSLIGLAVYCVLRFRRRLAPASLVLFSSVFSWMAIRAVLPLIQAMGIGEPQLSSTWSYLTDAIVFLIGIGMVISLDRLFGALFQPIPSTIFHGRAPLFVFVWNRGIGFPRVLGQATAAKAPRSRSVPSQRHTKNNLTDLTPRPTNSVIHRRVQPTAPTMTRTKAKRFANLKWFTSEVRRLVKSPIHAATEFLITFRAWYHSREKASLLKHSPTLLFLLMVLAAPVLAASSRLSLRIDGVSHESLSACTTEELAAACNQRREREFSQAIGGTLAPVLEQPTVLPSDSTKRYVELLSRRILSVEPYNQMAHFRLGLVLYLNSDFEQSESQIYQAASRNLSGFPLAESWLSKSWIIAKSKGEEIPEDKLQWHLSKACRSKDCDYRLLFLYASLLEANGELEEAIEVTERGVEANPRSILELARLYARLGREDELERIAKRAESYFRSQLKVEDCESNRLAIADARTLRNQLPAACEILSEGLAKEIGGSQMRRQLSEIQRVLYIHSIKRSPLDEVQMDLCWLEQAFESDPSNPSISNEIAKLLAVKTRPTKKLMEALKLHVDQGIANVATHLILAERYYSLGKILDAQVHWEAALAKEPTNVTALNNLASCLISHTPEEVDRSIEMVTLADKLSPGNPDILDTWGAAAMVAKRPYEAVNKYERAIYLDSKRIDIRKRLIAAYQAIGMQDMAVAQQKVVERLETR